MEILRKSKTLRSLCPFIWSKDPWDIPIIRISNKQTNGDIIEISTFKNINEKILQNKKNIKEWLKQIFFILIFIIH